jgi:hypothetical protein
VNISICAWTSPSAGKNQWYSHSGIIHYSMIGGLRRKAFDVERWLVDRRQVAPTASQRFGLLAGGRPRG